MGVYRNRRIKLSKYKYWTGIGSREVTDEITQLQITIGENMARRGYILLSGGAGGSDENFHKGVCNVDATLAQVWLPWKGFRLNEIDFDTTGTDYVVPTKAMFDRAATYYEESGVMPWFSNMKQGAQKLHGRNYNQIFSSQSTPASRVVIYAAPENAKGEVKGGTRSAVLIARNEGVPTYNLTIPEQRDKLLKLLGIED